MLEDPRYYPPAEERLNILTHAVAAIFSVIATIFMLTNVSERAQLIEILGLLVFGISMAATYSLSAMFHASRKIEIRRFFNFLDRASILLLVAGTATPFTLVLMDEHVNYLFTLVVWSFAIVGIIFHIRTSRSHFIWNTTGYAVFGWLVFLGLALFMPEKGEACIPLLFQGNLIYTLGAVFYTLDFIPFNHLIFHILTMTGSAFHFISALNYVLPLV